MESITQNIETAITSDDISKLLTLFDSNNFLTLGSGEQRTIHASFLKTSLAQQQSEFLLKAFASEEFVHWLENKCLRHLPIIVKDGVDNKIRRLLFEYFIQVNQYEHAARVLGTLRMNDEVGNPYYHTPSEKCDVYVQMAECYLMDDQYEAADAAVTKAGIVLGSLTDPDDQIPRALRLRYKSTYARVLDSSRKFQQAATQYFELSRAFDDASHDELMVMLGRAATCAILAPNGSQRRIIVSLICDDNRISKLEHLSDFRTHSALLQKIHSHQILYPDDVKYFEKGLSPHQKVTGADGFSMLSRSIIEHNLIAISNLYTNIHYKDLALLLGGIDEDIAVKIAARMIVSETLKASLDEVDKVLYFDQEKGYDYDAVGLGWDTAITNLCNKLNQVTDIIREQ